MTFSFGRYGYVGDDPAEVESAMTDLDRVAAVLGTLAGQVEGDTRSIALHWPAGHTGQVAGGDAARIGGALGECHQAFARAGRDLEVLHEVLVGGRRKVDELNDAHRALSGPENVLQFLSDVTFELRVEVEDAFGVAQARAGFGSVAEIDSAYAQVRAHVVEETGFCNELLSRLAASGSATAGSNGFAPTSGVSRYEMAFGLLTGWTGPEVADILAGLRAFPSDPQAGQEAWLALRPDQRAALLAGAPTRFGNLNGIPAADRNTANRLTLQTQLDRLTAAWSAAGIQPPRRPEDLEQISPLTFALLEGMSGLSRREAKQALLLTAQLGLGGEYAAARLLAFEPEAYGGKGRAAIAYGDVDHAANIAFCVPGLNSGLHNINEVAGDALHLLDQAHRADPGQVTAVVAWQGYDAPGLSDVLFQDNAEAGSKLLAADVNAMRTTHAGPIRMLTVVGHSYGSTTTGLALQREHMSVNTVALIGSPGMGGDARTAADLHLKRSQVFVGSASHDIVTTGADSLGANPSEGAFGKSVTRFKADSVDRSSWPVSFSDHSRYYRPGSESLYALGYVVTGQGDQLGQAGMLAEPRHFVPGDESSPGGYQVDPESSRTPTTGHDHANDLRGVSR
jgi:pimeloyl-ACP methyl ester carboxylesterase